MAAGAEFVEGWLVAQVLGEGAYGDLSAKLPRTSERSAAGVVSVTEGRHTLGTNQCRRPQMTDKPGRTYYKTVRLLVHARSGAAVALKVVRGEAGGAAGEPGGAAGEPGGAAREAGGAAREAALHRALRHPHVLRCLGERTHLGQHYMFLEYAPGGELFDRIEPDVGMREEEARRYWRQLLSGLAYLHGRGVAHRDIKPENLLLDSRDQLKISDFGMATLFRHGARERLMSRVCGTPPYAAPEVLRATARAYRAPPADLWAAALVLLAMLAGELPWERACGSDARYAAWSLWATRGGDVPRGPWRKLGAAALALFRRALQPEPERRAPLPALESLAWTRQAAEGEARAWRSQPTAADATDAPDELSAADMDALISYSQPAHADDLLLATPADAARVPLGRRMTRVWLRGDEAGALAALGDALRVRGYVWRRLHARLLAIECGAELRMRAWLLRCDAAGEARTLLEFRRSRGCGLQFKRRYVELRDALQPLHAPPPPHAELLHVPHYAT